MQNPYTKEEEQKVADFTMEAQKKIKQGKERLKDLVSTVDKQLNENPWPVVGGVAVGCMLLGFIMGQRKGG